MLLAVDVGNTQTHFGAFQGEQLLEHWRFATVRQSTADELGAALSSLLALRGYGFDDLDASIVSSTVPQLEPEWTAVAQRYLGHEMLVVGPGTKTGMAIRYDNPREIGADRLVNAVAIRERFGALAVCVDFGTATTFDVVSREGDYVGGALMTGIEISLEALSERGARLPEDRPRPAAQRDRQEHRRRDPLRASSSATQAPSTRSCAASTTSSASAPTVIATGGLARLVVPYTEEIEEVDDLLTLTGLRLLHERNT